MSPATPMLWGSQQLWITQGDSNELKLRYSYDAGINCDRCWKILHGLHVQ